MKMPWHRVDPYKLSADELREYTKQSRNLTTVVALAEKALKAMPKYKFPLPRVLLQDSYETNCQTFAVVNGLRFLWARNGHPVAEFTQEDVQSLRKQAGVLEGKQAARLPASIAHFLPDIMHTEEAHHPLHVLGTMITGGFVVTMGKESPKHVNTIVPDFTRVAPKEGVPRLLTLDSLSGMGAISISAFCGQLIHPEMYGVDHSIVCSTIEK